MQSVAAFIIVLGVLIAFHELGHFLVAKVMGMGVKTYSLGFGPKIFGKRYGRTEYRLSWIPLGGYVSLVGEREDEQLEEGFTANEHFNRRPAWQRTLVVLAGPVFNVVLAWLLFWGLFWAQGIYEPLPVIGDVRAESPAAEAGIVAGDRFLSINGRSIETWSDLSDVIAASGGDEISITLERDGQTLNKTIKPELMTRPNLFGEDEESYLIGIVGSGDYRVEPLGGGAAAVESIRRTWEIVALTVQGFIKLIERVIPLDTVGGPIMIAQLVSQQAEQGFGNLIALTALISVNLAIINLLPIPVLDGGHILFLVVEMIRRKPVSPRVQELTFKIGFALLITLMVLATYNDILRIFNGS
ncbi:RIP metalloprotease RseP [Oceanidesulfovibrio indonesiensis]|uniref:Zinc metalloprotease n=1 Tax=Oceanidesulfovibrio indonesiensis TaxID=54767 RepID=A0A7M3MCL8_9BACT|nr:RIP metalloprotease RseP [Oceanidesulfovibrio indonesiensis]TVM16219.1 RIP metalloprotease RseP [Oceanidesulfovibrio indonesiensis]